MKKELIEKLDGSFVVILITNNETNILEIGGVKHIVKQFNLDKDDFVLFDNYGTDYWLTVKKEKVDNTYFNVRDYIFLENAKVGDRIDFMSDRNSLYQITHIRRDPSDDDVNTSYMALRNIKQNGELGRLKATISSFKSSLNSTVKISFGRIQ
jgi:hypothetical protein